jgi:hypothetical protein
MVLEAQIQVLIVVVGWWADLAKSPKILRGCALGFFWSFWSLKEKRKSLFIAKPIII